MPRPPPLFQRSHVASQDPVCGGDSLLVLTPTSIHLFFQLPSQRILAYGPKTHLRDWSQIQSPILAPKGPAPSLKIPCPAPYPRRLFLESPVPLLPIRFKYPLPTSKSSPALQHTSPNSKAPLPTVAYFPSPVPSLFPLRFSFSSTVPRPFQQPPLGLQCQLPASKDPFSPIPVSPILQLSCHTPREPLRRALLLGRPLPTSNPPPRRLRDPASRVASPFLPPTLSHLQCLPPAQPSPLGTRSLMSPAFRDPCCTPAPGITTQLPPSRASSRPQS